VQFFSGKINKTRKEGKEKGMSGIFKRNVGRVISGSRNAQKNQRIVSLKLLFESDKGSCTRRRKGEPPYFGEWRKGFADPWG
jgi:hypothetical protein